MALFISAKERINQQLGHDVDTAFRQIEIWAKGLEAYLGVSLPPPSSDVPVGGLVSFKTGPGANTNYSAATTVFTDAVPLVQGHQYLITLSLTLGQQITNASGNAQLFCSDSSGLIIGGNGGFLRALSGAKVVGENAAGCDSTIVSPVASATDTFTVTASSGAASLTVFANSAQLIVIRVA